MNHHAAPYRTPAPRPFVQEEQLKSEVIQIERKQFVVTLKENPRGRFLRISEESSNRRNTIIIPATGLADFQKLLEEMVIADSETPPPAPSPEM
ncbi:MAG TPA: PUR family DNA/RNA-binding protein [Verrucomicrobiae bacterium]